MGGVLGAEPIVLAHLAGSRRNTTAKRTGRLRDALHVAATDSGRPPAPRASTRKHRREPTKINELEMASVDVLNRLLQLQNRSLPAYLAQASLYVNRGDQRVAAVLANIHANQQAAASRLADAILDRRGRVEAGTFPTHYTHLNFVSVSHLIPELIRHQKADIRAIERCVAQLQGDPEAQALAEEVLGAERAHLEQLQELAVEPAGA